MNKKLIYIIAAILVIIVLIFYFSNRNIIKEEIPLVAEGTNWTKEQNINLQQSLIDISEKYLAAVLLTNEVFTTDMSVTTYEEWKEKIDEAEQLWQEIQVDDVEFNNLLNELGVSQGEQVFVPNIEKGSLFGSIVYAESKAIGTPELGAVTAVFDSASHGQKLRTVMDVFGWDAKRALAQIQLEQNLLEAEAWNKEGDTYQRWETAAKVLKDTCKVTVFVGANIITAGGATAALTLGQGTILAVSGASLALEVGEDVYIAMGREGDAAFLRDAQEAIRPVTEIVSIISLKNLGDLNNLFYITDKTGQLYEFAKNGYVKITKKGDQIIISNEKPNVIIGGNDQNKEKQKNLEGTSEHDEPGVQNQQQTSNQQNTGPVESKIVPLDIPQGTMYLEGVLEFPGDTYNFAGGGSTAKYVGNGSITFSIDMTDSYGTGDSTYSIIGQIEGWYQEYVLCNKEAGSYGHYEGGYMCKKDGIDYNIGDWYAIGTKGDLTTEIDGYLDIPNDIYCQYYPSVCQEYPHGRVVLESPDKSFQYMGGFTSKDRTKVEGENWYANVIGN